MGLYQHDDLCLVERRARRGRSRAPLTSSAAPRDATASSPPGKPGAEQFRFVPSETQSRTERQRQAEPIRVLSVRGSSTDSALLVLSEERSVLARIAQAP